MRCATCSNDWPVDAEWVNRFHQGHEVCPNCGSNCETEARPDFWAPKEDLSYDDSKVLETFWYHTSTHANWPDRSFDPAVTITETTKQRLRRTRADGSGLERWIARQRTKALHLGTYEAAIENMLRRMANQAGANQQFYLYRVRLQHDATVEPGVQPERANISGDVQLTDLSADVLGYVNTHEDPSSISLAVRIEAILAVQRMHIPMAVNIAEAWVSTASARLADAAFLPASTPRTKLEQLQQRMPSALSVEALKLEEGVAGGLPYRLRSKFHRLFDEQDLLADPTAFPAKLMGLSRLVSDPLKALELLDTQPWREV